MKSKSFNLHITPILILKNHKNLVCCFREENIKVFFSFFSVAMATRMMINSKFCSGSFASHITLMLLIKIHNNCVSSFRWEYSRLSLSRTRISQILRNSKRLSESKKSFWWFYPTIIWRRILFYKSKLPEVQINLHFG